MPGVVVPQPPPAPRIIGPKTKSITRPAKPVPEYLTEEAKLTVKENFDPAKHLNIQPPEDIVMMKDIGLEGHGISLYAATEPFQLFTESAIRQFRREIFSEETLRDCHFASTFNKHMVRGMGPVYVRYPGLIHILCSY